MHKGFGLATAVALTAVVGTAHAADKLKIGVTATLEGTYTVLGEDGMRGYVLAVKAHGGKAGGKEIETIVGSTDASPDSAIRAAKKLVEQDKVDVLISPLSGAEGIADPRLFEDPAADHRDQCFVRRRGDDLWRSVRRHHSVADLLPLQHGRRPVACRPRRLRLQRQALQEDRDGRRGLCVHLHAGDGPYGGVLQGRRQISKRFWVPLGTKDFASVISSLPDDVDAIYLGLGGADAVNFLNQYQQAGGNAHLIGGSIMVDQTVLSSKGKAKDALIGTPRRERHGRRRPQPEMAGVREGLSADPKEGYFKNPSGARRFWRSATTTRRTPCSKRSTRSKAISATATRSSVQRCRTMVLDAPNGTIKLDENRQAIGTTSSPRS